MNYGGRFFAARMRIIEVYFKLTRLF